MNRLVINPQLLLLQRTAQFECRLDPFLGMGGQLFGIEGVAIAACTLGLEQRRIGVTQQLLGTQGAAGEQADTDADIDKQLMPVDLERLFEAIDDPLSQRRRVHHLRTAFSQHGELVTAEARQRDSWIDHRFQTLGHALEQLVPNAMPKAVVDHLEVVKIDHQ